MIYDFSAAGCRYLSRLIDNSRLIVYTNSNSKRQQMERFDDKGRMVVPDRAQVLLELEKRGVHYAGALHIHQAFCPRGHALITKDSHQFNGLPGIRAHMVGERADEVVTLTPFLLRRDKVGGAGFHLGDRVHICCHVCGIEMPVIAPCDCQWNGEFVMFSLEPDQAKLTGVCVCNIWGCPNGDIRMAGDVIAAYQRNYAL